MRIYGKLYNCLFNECHKYTCSLGTSHDQVGWGQGEGIFREIGISLVIYQCVCGGGGGGGGGGCRVRNK